MSDRPSLPLGLAAARAQAEVMTDPHADGPRILRTCPVMVLVVRNRVVGRYNDIIVLILGDGRELYFWGNADPGRLGWRAAIKKYYPRLRRGVWPQIRGRHSIRPNRFRQPNATQAADAGLPLCFDDFRALGYVEVDRMENASKVAKTEHGYFAINFHDGGETKTGSAGCITLPPKPYLEMRDAAYAALDAAGQTWLPLVVVDGPL